MNNVSFDKYWQENKDKILNEWQDYLSFASISSYPDFLDERLNCARWIASHLEKIGFNAQLLDNDNHPPVYAVKRGEANAPTILIYGHYDLQGPGNLRRWITPPFEANIRDGRMYARGARDNKGQHFFWIKAIEALTEMGHKKGCTIKVLLDGEEESGSLGLLKRMEGWHSLLKADYLIASETAGLSNGCPAIIMGLRGASCIHFRVHGPAFELHSGTHGGLVQNPAAAVSKMLASLYDSDGRVAVPDFYENVVERSAEERALAAKIPFDEEEYKSKFGIAKLAGEQDYPPIERISFRPNLEINGIVSGSAGPDIKTSVPTHADVALTLRTVPNQITDQLNSKIVAHLKLNMPEGFRLEVLRQDDFGAALFFDVNSPIFATAQGVAKDTLDEELAYLWAGASLPAISRLRECTGAELLLVGFGVAADNEHGFNESFSIDQFRKGFLFGCGLVDALGNTGS